MPNINELKESRFLKKEDCGKGILATINEVRQENMALQGDPEEMKWCLHFVEDIKPCTLNSTNAQAIAGFTGKQNTDDWRGIKVVLYNEPNVMMKGKLTGGIRVRAPRNQPVTVPPTAPSPAPVQPHHTPATAPTNAAGEVTFVPPGVAPESDSDIQF